MTTGTLPTLDKPIGSAYVPTSEEKNWAMLAHLSVLVNLFTAILGPVAAAIIYFAFRDRSRYISYHALQSLILQLIVWVGGGVIVGGTWAVTGILSIFVIGLCLVPFAILISCLPIIAPVYGIVAAIQTSQGSDFKYWLIGDWVRGTLLN
jgi:uncharacterized Tic20 family protein